MVARYKLLHVISFPISSTYERSRLALCNRASPHPSTYVEAALKIINRLVYLRKWRIVREILALYCIEIPATVKIGNNFELIHRGFGTVIHPNTTIGNNVKIFHGVTIGRADAYTHGSRSMMKSIVIGDDAVICPGAVILGGPGVTSVGKGTVIAANAVLTVSTGEHEIWGGIPARKLSNRRS